VGDPVRVDLRIAQMRDLHHRKYRVPEPARCLNACFAGNDRLVRIDQRRPHNPEFADRRHQGCHLAFRMFTRVALVRPKLIDRDALDRPKPVK